MEKKNSNSMKQVNSRNRNKNKNKTLQNRAKELKQAKLERTRKVAQDVEDLLEEVVLVDDVAVRDDVIVVPEREVDALEEVDEDSQYDYDEVVSETLDEEDLETMTIEFENDTETEEDDFIEVKVNKFMFDAEQQANSDKFNFVLSDQSFDDDELEEFHAANVSDDAVVESVVREISEYDDVKVETVDVDDEIIPRTTDKVDVNAKRHISFEKRVGGLLLAILISFFIAGLLIFKAVTHEDNKAITYDETGTIKYNVCINNLQTGEYYQSSCLGEDMEYLTNVTERMPVSFEYKVNYSAAVERSINYYVTTKLVISKDEAGKVLNTVEDVLVDRTNYDVFGEKAEFLVDVEVPVKKYVDYLNNYNNQFGITSYATLEVSFYVDNENVIKKAGSLTMPVSTTTFNVEKTEVTEDNLNLTVNNNDWGNINTSYAVVGLIFVLVGMLCIIRLADLVYKTMGVTSLYQRKLNKILREYDRLIVVARDEYNVDTSKKLIKVATFSELLDARDTLEKPIVFLKINNVKCEFYVEDSEAVYKYTMKEADFGGK